jgi:transposase
MTTDEKLIKNKLGLLQLAAYLKSVSEACRVMGCSRDTFYRIKKAHEEGGIEALRETSRRRPNLRNRVAEDIEQAVVVWRAEESRDGGRQKTVTPSS